ncbi:MAG: hypothetical protein ABJO30_05540 [Hyphomicrobiales bacterium]
MKPTLGFMEPPVPGFFMRWCKRFDRLFRDMRFLLSLACLCIAAIGAIQLSEIIAALDKALVDFGYPFVQTIWSSLWGILRWVNASWLVETFAITLIPAALLTLLLNTHLPTHLKLKIPEFLRDRVSWAWKWFPDKLHGRAWLKWAKHKLYNSGDIATLIVRNIQEWHPEDHVALDKLIAAKPEHKSLIIILDAPTRTIVDRVLLRALEDASSIKTKAATADIILTHIGPEIDHFRIDAEETKQSKLHVSFAALFGISKNDKLDDDYRAEVERTSDAITDRLFSEKDILPLLTIGSTYLAPFQLTRPVTLGKEALATFSKLMTNYQNVFHRITKPSDHVVFDEKKADQIVRQAEKSLAVLVVKQNEKRRRFTNSRVYKILGRYAQRDAMAWHIGEQFKDANGGYFEYILAMLNCGEFYALEHAFQQLTKKKGLPSVQFCKA